MTVVKKLKPDREPVSIDQLQRELERVNAEIAAVLEHVVAQAMDQILALMQEFSLSLADLERRRRKRRTGALETLRFRDPVTGDHWSVGQKRSSAAARGRSQSASKQFDATPHIAMLPPESALEN